MQPSLSVSCFLTVKVSISKLAVRTPQEFAFPWEKKT